MIGVAQDNGVPQTADEESSAKSQRTVGSIKAVKYLEEELILLIVRAKGPLDDRKSIHFVLQHESVRRWLTKNHFSPIMQMVFPARFSTDQLAS
jgi:hypothetical protein